MARTSAVGSAIVRRTGRTGQQREEQTARWVHKNVQATFKVNHSEGKVILAQRSRSHLQRLDRVQPHLDIMTCGLAPNGLSISEEWRRLA